MENEKKEGGNNFRFDWKIVLIIIMAIVIIVGIAYFVLSNRYTKETANNDTHISKIESDNTETNIENNNVESDEENTNTTEVNKIGTEEDEIKTINFNKTVTKAEEYSLTVKKSKIGKKIEPPNTSGYYRYYNASAGHQYLEIVYNYKNLTASDVEADEISSIKIKYNDKYEYTGFAVIEDSDGDFTYSNITSIPALSTGKMHYLIEIPDEVAKSKGSIVATINCGQDSYQIKLR